MEISKETEREPSPTLSVSEIIQATQGTLIMGDPRTTVEVLSPKDSRRKEHLRVSIDSRTLRRGDIFFAIKGEKFDGNQFIDDVIRKGASICVIREIPPSLVISNTKYTNIIKVKNPREALGDCARIWRLKMGNNIQQLGISGSCGKTTIKELITHILSKVGPTVSSTGNFNNEVGCPLSIFSMKNTHKFGVFEMGACRVNEVKYLSQIVLPRIGVVTNINIEHSATFGNLEKIAEGESEILQSLPDNGWAILPFDDSFFEFLKSRLPKNRSIKVKSFGLSKSASVYAKDISVWPQPTKFTLVHQNDREEILDEVRCTLTAAGRFNIMNACAAAAACLALGVQPNVIAEAFSDFIIPPMRFQILKLKGGAIVVNDCYNANPGSMRIALESFIESFPDKKLCVVLGDMLELGEISSNEHRLLGKSLAGFPLSRVVLFGPQSRYTSEGAKNFFVNENVIQYCEDRQSLENAARSLVKPGTATLFKASRDMRFEEIIEKIAD